jgi:KamA family protein
MANDQQLQTFIEMLAPLKQITRVRIHTRLPVVLPSRISPELLNLLASQPFKTIMVLHINHANEISPELKDKAAQLKQAGVLLLNQAVLLKRINDTLHSQNSLSETLFSADILPYYLHLLDKVSGASHFDIDEKEAKTLYQNMLAELPGFLVPKLVREIGGEQSKTPIPPY